ncbi:RES family NAD+ phosphorylase [Chenggangzhangella methanolivorans]|uniref:RES family NAD+ phosphorylase n=1 Tax=Chenggangzhangella methanolivorans TaxID=1437009 RepID=UPI00360B529E
MGSQPDTGLLTVWRISNHQDLSGRGGLIASGRWHSRPRAVMWCSDAPATAYAEILRHVGSPELLPDAVCLLKIVAPRWARVDALDASHLPEDWRDDFGPGFTACQRAGDAWLASASAPLLKAPSVARPGAYNFLLNPTHRDADHFEIVDAFGPPLPDWAADETSAEAGVFQRRGGNGVLAAGSDE